MATLPKISILIPAHNEEGNIARLFERLDIAVSGIGRSTEIVIVDDGSTDKTAEKIRAESEKNANIHCITHDKCLGATEALKSGFSAVRGDIVILLPADLESDPAEDVPLLMEKMDQGYDVVTGWRVSRGDNKQFASWFANAISRLVFRTNVHDMNWIKAFRRDLISGINLQSQWHRYLVPIWAHGRYKITEVRTNWYHRTAGHSKFGFRRLYVSLVDFVTLLYLLTFFPDRVYTKQSVNTKPKVCMITSVFPRSVGDRPGCFLLESAEHIKRAGVDMHIFAPSFEGLEDHVISGIQVHRFRYFPARWENLTHTMESAHRRVNNKFYLIVTVFYMLFGLIAIARLNRKERFDILHVHWPFPHGLFGVVGAIFGGSRVVSSFHGAEILLAKQHAWIRPILRYFVKKSDGITCNSNFTARQLGSISNAASRVVPYGSVIEEKSYVKVHEGQKSILYVGRLVERKGVQYLIRALPEILEQVDAKIFIAGEGDQRPILEKEIQSLGLSGRVELCGFVSNERLTELYQNCDLFVLPAVEDRYNDTEGLGVVLVEALSYKKPVVASNVGGIVDIIKHDKTGILVEQKSEEELAAAISRILMDPELAERLGTEGYKFIKAEFNWDSITDKILDVYKESLANNKLHTSTNSIDN